MDDPLAFPEEDMTNLGLTLNFGPADLEDNQDGLLSPAQVARLENDLRWFYWPMIGGLAGFAFLVGTASALSGQLALVPVVVLMALAAIPAALLNLERGRLPERAVLRSTLRLGGFSLVARRWGFFDEELAAGNVHYPVQGGKKVFGPKHLYKVLRSGQTYLVYYAPVRTWYGFRLLSLEPLEDAPPASRPRRKAKAKPKR